MTHRSTSRWLREPGHAAAMVIALALAMPACAKSSDTSGPSSESGATTTTAAAQVTIGDQTVVVRGRAAVSGSQAVKVEDNYFEPNLLTAPAGATITLQLTNTGSSLPNFSESAEGIDHDLTPGAAFTATLHVPSSGPLVFFCKHHRDESGMIGAVNRA